MHHNIRIKAGNNAGITNLLVFCQSSEIQKSWKHAIYRGCVMEQKHYIGEFCLLFDSKALKYTQARICLFCMEKSAFRGKRTRFCIFLPQIILLASIMVLLRSREAGWSIPFWTSSKLNRLKFSRIQFGFSVLKISVMMCCQSQRRMICAEDVKCVKQQMRGFHQSDAT